MIIPNYTPLASVSPLNSRLMNSLDYIVNITKFKPKLSS